MNNLNLFQNLKDTTVSETIPINDWLSNIKDGTYNSYAKSARSSKSTKEIIKQTAPCVLYNFVLEKSRLTKNILTDTGFLFIDIDKNIDISIIDKSKVYALYSSIGGVGIHIIVKVSNLTIENYDEAYSYIINDLNITNFVDINAKGKIQPALCSFDPDLYLNKNSKEYNLSDLITTVSQSPLINPIKRKTYEANGIHQKFRYSNVKDFNFESKDYIMNWGNLDFVQSFKAKNVKNGKRKVTLLAYCNNFVILNPHLTKEEVISIIANVNSSMCETPLDFKDIISVVTSIFKYKEDGTLKPINKKRSIIFNPHSEFNAEEKVEITLQLLAERKSNISKDKLYSIIENWDYSNGAISVRNIAKNHPISMKTVTKYYKEFKDYIQEMNMTHKLS